MLGEILNNVAPEGALPMYPMHESKVCVEVLLRLLYPVLDVEFSDANLFRDVLRAAQKYELHIVKRAGRSQWMKFVKTSPLAFYFLAVELGWKEEAVACAQKLLPRGFHRQYNAHLRGPGHRQSAAFAFSIYTPEMESVSSVPFQRLLSYLDDCWTAATSRLELSRLPTPTHSRRWPLNGTARFLKTSLNYSMKRSV